MYYDEFLPFYTAYAGTGVYPGEEMQEKEFDLMKSWYPETARRLQDRVEEECQLLDYEGSRIYDEYPDRFMLRRMCDRLREKEQGEMEAEDIVPGVIDELLEVLFWQEISRRRCRHRRCRGY